MSNTAENDTNQPIRVIAKYKFEGRNNDELSFAKNDVIIVTQQLEGGWYEGCLGDKVGWFPSDYVGVIKTQSNGKTNGARLSSNTEMDEELEKKRVKFRHEILNGTDGFMAKEKEHIEKLMKFPSEFLPLIHEQHVLTSNEFKTISTNILPIIEAKKSLFDALEVELTKDVMKQEIGAIFLNQAIEFKNLLIAYCVNHPVAMALIVKKKDSIEKVLKSKGIDVKEFISGLSLVFRHTEKYASILQEVDRNSPNSPDKGNLQRASSVYRDIFDDCLATRKQKEVQLEFLGSGILEKSFGKSYEQKLGPIVHVSSVTLTLSDSQNEDDLLDRCFAVFKNVCLFLEVTNEKNLFALKEQFPSTNLCIQCDDVLAKVTFLKDSKLLFAVTSLTLDDYRRLCSVLRDFPFEERAITNSFNVQEVRSVSPRKAETERMPSMSPTKHIEFANLPQAKKAISQTKNQITKNGNITLNHQLEMIFPDGLVDSNAQKPPLMPGSSAGTPRAHRNAKLYTGWCLRPSPSTVNRVGGLQTTTSSSSIKLRKGLTIEEQEDSYLLKIVEGYCTPPSANGLSGSSSRMNVSTISNYPLPRRATSYPEEMRPQLIMANDEKIFVEEVEGNETVVKEKSLVDTVYQLQSQVTNLQKEFVFMKNLFSHEQKTRRRLEEVLRKMHKDFPQLPTPQPIEDTTN